MKAWRPDLVGRSDADWLIIELKGKPPANKLPYAIRQVIRYGREFHAVWPSARIRLLVIGPYRGRERYEHEGYHVLTLDWQALAEDILRCAERALLSRMADPFIDSSPIFLEDAILSIEAVKAPELAIETPE